MTPRSQDIIARLSDIVGPGYVTGDTSACFAYSMDASLFGGTEAAIVVRPKTTDEVSQILNFAYKNRIPVVTRGGGASIYGQPKGRPGENILIDMTRMNTVLDLNPTSMTVRAQAGIIMGKLQHACKTAGFYIYAPFAPLHIVSLGGWMSGAAGSAGLWRDIVGLTVVLPNGTVVQTGGGPGTNRNQRLFYNRNLGGPDLTGLFIGDGGSFGIKTEAVVRITPYPKVLRASIFEFESLERVLALIERHVGRVDPHPFEPVMVFGPGAMKNFMPEFEASTAFTVQGMMQGHTEEEIQVKQVIFNRIAEELGGVRTPMLDAMAEAMAASGSEGSDMEMDWLSLFNGLGIAAWLPFTLPREGFQKVYRKLIDWRTERLRDATSLGFRYRATWEFFAPTDASTLIGEIDAFFEPSDDPAVFAYIRDMMADFQDFAHQLGSIDVYNQGIMSSINASFWSEGYASLFKTIQQALDPQHILNPGLWERTKSER